jgi:AhpD family alkylhydroperoxidase
LLSTNSEKSNVPRWDSPPNRNSDEKNSYLKKNRRMNLMTQNPFDLFQKECPELAAKFNALVDAQRNFKGLDNKTKQLLNIAIQTANRNPRGVMFHAMMAKQAGAKREEIIGAVVMNLHLSGLASVLDSLPAAVEGFDSTH